MTVINFPNSPTTGQIFVAGDRKWQWDGGKWISVVTNEPSITTLATPPVNPQPGDIWYNSTNTRTYTYYDSFWVEQAASVAAVGLFDGGAPDSVYGGIETIDAGRP